MTTVLSFVIVIGILILVHELGHFFVARWTGVGVERFSIGFGPVLARWRGKETEYCLSAIPMGGYVKMVGEESPLEGGGTPVYDPQKAFALKPLWARFLIVFAGPGMNFVLAAADLRRRPGDPRAPGLSRARRTGRRGRARRGRAPATWRRRSRGRRTADRVLGGASTGRSPRRRASHSA